MEQNWKRKEYESWDEAFRALTPIVRQQSVRVAAYTQVLFVKAVKIKLLYFLNCRATSVAYKCQKYKYEPF